MTNRLKPKEVAAYRKRLLAKQGGLCALCKLPIEPGQDTLDHCHDSGHCRGVLHRNCNQLDGRILQWAKRSGINPAKFLEQLLGWWKGDYSHNPLHPNGTRTQQRELTRLRRRLRNAKTEKTRKRLREAMRTIREA